MKKQLALAAFGITLCAFSGTAKAQIIVQPTIIQPAPPPPVVVPYYAPYPYVVEYPVYRRRFYNDDWRYWHGPHPVYAPRPAARHDRPHW